jgi:uncharacterized membrane protein YbaN (DUF454 family)
LRKIVLTVVGSILVTLGIIGIVLPVMPGWLFLIPGLVILSNYFPGIKRLLRWAREKAGQARSKLQ